VHDHAVVNDRDSEYIWARLISICDAPANDILLWGARTDKANHWSNYVDSWAYDLQDTSWPGDAGLAYWQFSPWSDPYGYYEAEGCRAAGCDPHQNYVYFWILPGSRAVTTATRSGKFVYVSAHVTFYNSKICCDGAFTASASRSVTFYDQRSGGWHADGSMTTGKLGNTGKLKIYAPSTRYFKVKVAKSNKVFGVWSKALRR